MKIKAFISGGIALALITMWVLFGLNSCSPKKETPVVTDKTTKEEIKKPNASTTKEEVKEETKEDETGTVAPRPKYYLKANDQVMERFGQYAGSIELADVCNPNYFDQFKAFKAQVSFQISLYQNQILVNKTKYENYKDFETMIDVYQAIEQEMAKLVVGLENQDLVNSIEALKGIQVYYEQLVMIKGVVNGV